MPRHPIRRLRLIRLWKKGKKNVKYIQRYVELKRKWNMIYHSNTYTAKYFHLDLLFFRITINIEFLHLFENMEVKK